MHPDRARLANALRHRRDACADAYARAIRHHRGQAEAAARLRAAMTALLKAEVAQPVRKARRPKIEIPADLFAHGPALSNATLERPTA